MPCFVNFYMVRPKVYTESSFEVWPKKTLLGLDKSKSHCFTLPKQVFEKICSIYSLSNESLQQDFFLIHRGREYPAQVRLVQMNRSKPITLTQSALPARQVIQFGWKSYTTTKSMFTRNLSNVYEILANEEKNSRFSVLFELVDQKRFKVTFRMDLQAMHDDG